MTLPFSRNHWPFALASRISGGQQGWFMYFAIYLDESGKTHPRWDYTSLCGYYGTHDEFARLSDAWDNLRVGWDVPPIHMSKIMLDWANEPKRNHEWGKKYDELKDIWEDWRERMLNEFATLIFRTNIASVGSVVDSAAYQKVQLDPDCYLHDKDSNVFALQMAVTMALDRIQRIDPRPSVQLIIDDDEDHAIDYYDRLKNLRSMPLFDKLPESMKPRFERMRDCIHGISFYNDRFHPPLQAADMISYVARGFKVRRKKKLEEHPNELYGLLTHSWLNQPKYYSEENLFEIARRVHQKIEAYRDGENCSGV